MKHLSAVIILLLITSGIAFAQQEGGIDSAWTHLMQESGCLTGGQNVRDGKVGSEHYALTESKAWKAFLARDKKELVPFLIAQIGDTNTTRTHTCPCYAAKEGELAIYCLQLLLLKNWFDLPEFKVYASRETAGCPDTHQAWLWVIIADRKKAKHMQQAWAKYYRQNQEGK